VVVVMASAFVGVRMQAAIVPAVTVRHVSLTWCPLGGPWRLPPLAPPVSGHAATSHTIPPTLCGCDQLQTRVMWTEYRAAAGRAHSRCSQPCLAGAPKVALLEVREPSPRATP